MHGSGLELTLVFLLAAVIAVPVFKRLGIGAVLAYLVAGVVLGLGLTLLFARAMASLLYGVEPVDPLSLSAAASLVVMVTLVASYVPARRASRVNPIAALRHE